MDSTAVMGKRIGAYVIDAILGFIVSVIGFFALADSAETFFDPCAFEGSPPMCLYAGDTVYSAEGGGAAAILFISFGFWLFMGWIVQGLTGGTPGKLMVGLRVVDQQTGEHAGLGKCLGRTVMWIADGQPFGLPLVGLITGVSSKGHRRVGDMVAKTLVVDKTSVGQVPQVPGLTVPEGAGYAPAPPAGTYAPAPPPGAAPVAPAAVPDPGDGVDAPKWDAERGAYIQWDKQQQVWMTYDDASSEWRQIT